MKSFVNPSLLLIAVVLLLLNLMHAANAKPTLGSGPGRPHFHLQLVYVRPSSRRGPLDVNPQLLQLSEQGWEIKALTNCGATTQGGGDCVLVQQTH